MVIFTIVDYWRYNSIYPVRNAIKDTTEKYELTANKAKEKTHQYHDKIFKEILDNKKELANFMKKYLKCEEIKEKNIEKYNRKFVTKNFKSKESDIIYKIKDKNVFILIEHQRKIDYKMPKRITEYCIELIRNVIKSENKDTIYPLIYPIVLYTGNKKWNAPLTIGDNQEKYCGFSQLNYPKYNLVDVNNYTKEELIDEKSMIAKAMLFEKIESKEEFEKTMYLLMKKGLNKEEVKCIKMILNYSNVINEKYPDEAEKWREKIKKKEGVGSMTQFEKFFIQIFDDRYQEAEEKGTKAGLEKGMKKGMKEGIQKGMQKGQKAEKIEVVKRMLKMNMKDKEILHIARIEKNELQKLKEELKA